MSWPLFTLFMVFFISIGSQCLPWPFLKVPSYVISTSEFTNGTKAGVHHRPLPCPWFLTFQKSTSSGLDICGAFYSCFFKGSQKVTVQTLFPEWLSGQVSLTIMLVTLTVIVMVTIPDPRSPSPASRVTHRPRSTTFCLLSPKPPSILNNPRLAASLINLKERKISMVNEIHWWTRLETLTLVLDNINTAGQPSLLKTIIVTLRTDTDN